MIKGYETKDVKASKTKKADSIIKKEDDGLFYFTFKGDKHGFLFNYPERLLGVVRGDKMEWYCARLL